MTMNFNPPSFLGSRPYGSPMVSLSRNAYFDAGNGSIGYGCTYGEQSYNCQPLKSGPLGAFWGDQTKVLYDPFAEGTHRAFPNPVVNVNQGSTPGQISINITYDMPGFRPGQSPPPPPMHHNRSTTS